MTENTEIPENFSGRGKNYQKKVVQALFEDHQWAEQMFEVLKEEYFDVAFIQVIVALLRAYYEKYQVLPSEETFVSLLNETLVKDGEKLLKNQIVDFIAEIKSKPLANDSDIIKDTALKFCVRKALGGEVVKIAHDIQFTNFDSDAIVERMQKAAYIGASRDTGHDYMGEFTKRCQLIHRNGIATGFQALDDKNVLNGGLEPGEIGTVIAAAGCHEKGTEVITYDGLLVKVEDVKPGVHRLMGPDSTPRNVLRLVRGYGKMYKIIPDKGESFVVNDEHILSLVDYENCIKNISVKDYIKKCSESKSYKNNTKLYRSGEITFEDKKSHLKIDPYFLGLLVGSARFSNKSICFSIPDEKLLDYVFEQSDKLNLNLEVKSKNSLLDINLTLKEDNKNSLMNELLNLDFTCSDSTGDDACVIKSIPHSYKTSCPSSRLSLLSGIIDSKGEFDTCTNNFKIYSEYKSLIRDIDFVSKSLGFGCYACFDECEIGIIHKAEIYGSCYALPTKLINYQEGLFDYREILQTGFSVEPLGMDNYYGFTLDKDHLYLMKDFTVTHNCGKSMMLVNIAANALRQGKNVLYYTLELAEHKIGIRFDSNFSGIGQSDVPFNKELVAKSLEENCKGKLYIKAFPPRAATTNHFKNHIRQLKNQRGFTPDLICVDYADIMGEVMTNVRRGGESAYESQGGVYEQIRAFSLEVNCPVWTASQGVRSASSERILKAEHIAESFRKMHTADFACGLSRTPEDKLEGTGRLTIIKNRAGQDGQVFPITLNTSTVQMEIFEQMTIEAIEDMEQGAKANRQSSLMKTLATKIAEHKEKRDN